MRTIRPTESFQLPFGMRGANSEMLLTVPIPAQARAKAATETNTTQMQNYCKTIGALAAASALVAGNASAEVEYELHTGYTSEYLFRGLNLGQDLVEVGADVATEWNGLGLSAGAWYASFNAPTGFPGAFNNADADELDIYAEVSKDLGFVTAAVGYIYYHFPQGRANKALVPVDDAQEVYFSLARDFGIFNASLTYYWDIETDNDGYSELALDRSFELNSCLDLVVATNVGYLAEQGQCTAWTTKVGLDWEFAERATLSPFIALAIALSDDVDTAYDGSRNELVAGSMLSVSF
jgi:hypothetical protein